MSGLQSSPLPGSKYTISLKLSSVYDSSKTVLLKAALLEGITADLPAAEISGVKELPCFQGLQLADSAFDKPGRVDLLLGLDVILGYSFLDESWTQTIISVHHSSFLGGQLEAQ